MNLTGLKLSVSSEIGTLRALLIHSPDSGLGKVVPSKAQDWLFEDIVHLDILRKHEYDYYLKILLYFLDPDLIKGKLEEIDQSSQRRSFFKPRNPAFHGSRKVVELEGLLADILAEPPTRQKLVASVCALEDCSYRLQDEFNAMPAGDLASMLISGSVNGKMHFAPIPNLIFTRDIGIVINDHILLNKPAKKARLRETLIAKYLFFNHPLFASYRENVLEIPNSFNNFLRPGDDTDEKTTLEGGDVMVVSPSHILIGCSERTSVSGASEAVKLLFEKGVITKATLIRIPHKRDFMHIDTLFTQVKRDTWVVLGSVASRQVKPEPEPADRFTDKKSKDKTQIMQFEKGRVGQPREFACIEDLLDDISSNDLGSTIPTTFIYSGNNSFPFDAREQWTDSCNLLALKEGVVIGYDRNDKTAEAFREKGFSVIKAADLVQQFENGGTDPQSLTNTLITVPSAELSRARGGFHCMSMPLNRSEL
ncbi:arginine deiminase family protein [Hufsiella ginkgonis]|uniref:arginine deiminase n=1 Tax=Hufsiella ginkgonis TaxID=2695274 RepID=A0A7K1Y005_9SPHI|nr:arginine deiminase family protein [Hufsiella ginkgonis]MXV16605.1 amidinotransferase [Hufsiella ginkgonis]